MITKEFVIETPLIELREMIFKEDDEGRYRERIMDMIKEIGVKKWFELKGLPTDENSVWKNRYTGSESTLKNELNTYNKNPYTDGFEATGYFLWENWLPKDMFVDDDLFDEYNPKKGQTTLGGETAMKTFSAGKDSLKVKSYSPNKEQIKLGESAEGKKEELDKQKKEAEAWKIKRDKEEAEFKANYKGGSTSVVFHDGFYYFWGDVSHCGKESIVHNAKAIRNLMLSNKKTYGHMNYNNLPTFDDLSKESFKSFKGWEALEEQRTELYEDDLYRFKGDEVELFDTINDEEQKQIYCLGEKDGL